MIHLLIYQLLLIIYSHAYTVKTSVLFETSVLNMWRVILNCACYFDNHVCLFH